MTIAGLGLAWFVYSALVPDTLWTKPVGDSSGASNTCHQVVQEQLNEIRPMNLPFYRGERVAGDSPKFTVTGVLDTGDLDNALIQYRYECRVHWSPGTNGGDYAVSVDLYDVP